MSVPGPYLLLELTDCVCSRPYLLLELTDCVCSRPYLLLELTDCVCSRPYLLLELARLALQQDFADIAQQAVEHIKQSAHLIKVSHDAVAHAAVAWCYKS